MARLLLGVSGGIAAYKALEATRLAIKAGHTVRVIQTPASKRFVGAASFAGITGAPVLSSDTEPDPLRGAYPGEALPDRTPISHLALAERAELFLIAPASANTLAKLAHGLADNLIATSALAAPCPVLVAPAMNNRMYLHAATQANLELLAARGVIVIPPGEGELASHGEHGVGRMAEPAELLAACEAQLLLHQSGQIESPWRGRRVLVTAGGTREPIDSVRFIGNRSSGRMGLAVAEQALRRGAEVTLIAANVSLPLPGGARLISVRTAAEMAAACRAEFPASDALLMAAAVADFRPARAAETKLKKDRGAPQIELEPTEDVVSALAAERRPGQLVVGFAAEHGDDAVAFGREKLQRKRLDAIVVNDIAQAGIGFEADQNEVTIITRDGIEQRVARTGKEQVAATILDRVESLISGPGTIGRGKEGEDRAVRADTAGTARV
jgi:phosphopantothenoylcysteine decarboxylase/phosphopantothenate--cysteine ligase